MEPYAQKGFKAPINIMKSNRSCYTGIKKGNKKSSQSASTLPYGPSACWPGGGGRPYQDQGILPGALGSFQRLGALGVPQAAEGFTLFLPKLSPFGLFFGH